MLENSLSLEQFKLLALRYQKIKRKSKKKADEDLYRYISDRSFLIKKRCGYFK